MTRCVAVLCAWLLCAQLVGCARASQEPKQVPQRAADSAIRQWLSDARLAHATSKLARLMNKPKDQEAALMVLTALAQRAPLAVRQLEEGPSLIRDLACDAADLALRLQSFDRAQTAIELGLALPGEDAFRTQLWILAAENARARGDHAAESKALAEARKSLDAPSPR